MQIIGPANKSAKKVQDSPLPMKQLPFELSQLASAFQLPLKQIADISSLCKLADDPSKTIPIPLIMPYLNSCSHNGFYVFNGDVPCPDMMCVHLGSKHYHCSRPRCFYVTNVEDHLSLHSNDFHDNIDIVDGFAFYDAAVDCRMPSCTLNKCKQHFHCTQNGCTFSFVQYSAMSWHQEQHRNDASHSESKAQLTKNTDHQPSGNHSTRRKSPKGDNRPSLPSPNAQMAMFTNPDLILASIDKSLYNETNPCNSPFCKLKRKDHHHCNICNQVSLCQCLLFV